MMDYKKLGFGLGLFSIALGAVELFASAKVTETLDAKGHEGLVKGFGARELFAGATLIASPAAATGVWSRVAGDAMDLGALGLQASRAPRNKAVWGSIAFVSAVTALDVFTARGLDATTGKTSPARAPAPAA